MNIQRKIENKIYKGEGKSKNQSQRHKKFIEEKEEIYKIASILLFKLKISQATSMKFDPFNPYIHKKINLNKQDV